MQYSKKYVAFDSRIIFVLFTDLGLFGSILYHFSQTVSFLLFFNAKF